MNRIIFLFQTVFLNKGAFSLDATTLRQNRSRDENCIIAL